RTMSRLEAGLDKAIDVVRAAVHAVEQARRAEDARAVRGADADVGLAQLAHLEQVAEVDVDGRVEIEQQLRGVAPAQVLVALLAERHAARVGNTAAEAEARAQGVAPPRAEVVVELVIGVDLPR